jgi:hypothetical protein
MAAENCLGWFQANENVYRIEPKPAYFIMTSAGKEAFGL